MPHADVAPFRQFVVKVHSRCDLACDHCYMYEAADQSWLGKPKLLSLHTASQIGESVAKHAATHALDAVRFILHGGEPLLAGPRHLRGVIQALRAALDGVAEVDLRIHTNGVLLNEEFCDLFAQYDVSVGVSLDGDRTANDRHRRYADGRTSHPRVLAALSLLRRPEYARLYAGILCTVDIANDPVAVYEALRAEEPPRIDLLLPHATWDTPPPRPIDPDTGAPSATAYADWLIRIHELWTRDRRPFGIRIFESVDSTLHGGPPLTEALGLAPSDLLVLETDGTIEQLDALKVTFAGAPATGLSVFDDPLDAAAEHPGLRARRAGLDGLSAQCRACPVVTSCGGGLYPHRYKTGSGFDNPTVYCADLLRLIGYIQQSEHRPANPGAASASVYHSLSSSSMDELAAGAGGADAVAELVEAQHSRNRTLLAEAAARLSRDPRAEAAWEILKAADQHSADSLTTTLAHPYFRTWAERIRRVTPTAADAGYLTSIALVAATRAGNEAELEVIARDGVIHLPGLGRFVLEAGADRGTIRTAPGALPVVARALPVAQWQPARTLEADGISVLLEDCDPYRDCYQQPVSTRLTAAESADWRESFTAAWQLILRDYTAYAPALARGLIALTPLRSSPDSASTGTAAATNREAFGAIALSLPTAAEEFALLLIEQFQSVKLGAVLDLFDLYDPHRAADEPAYHSPWHSGPQSLRTLFAETYARMATTTALAETRQAAQTLVTSGALTPIGLRFAEGMLAAL